METTKTAWAIDASHSEIGFKVKHLVVSNLRGTFGEYEASIYTTGDDFTNAAITFSLHTASINTRNEQRDAHLKAADFFDAERFNEISFVANSSAGAIISGFTDSIALRGIPSNFAVVGS